MNAGFPQLAQSIGHLAGVMLNLSNWFQQHFTTVTNCTGNCCSCVQGQGSRVCDQIEQTILSKQDKILTMLITLLGEAQGRLLSVVPPVGAPINAPAMGQPPINAPLLGGGPPNAGIGAPVVPGQQAGQLQAGQPGYQQYQPPPLPQQAGALTQTTPAQPFTPSGLQGGGGISPGTAEPSPGSPSQSQSKTQTGTPLTVQPGQPIQIPSGGGPCIIQVTCIDIALATAIGNAIANAVGNMLKPLLPSIAPFIPPITPTPQQQTQPLRTVRYKAPFQFESGPTIYTDSLDSWFEPDDDAAEGEIQDEEGEELV